MQEPQDHFGDKLGWLIAFALVGGIFIYAVLQFPSLQAMACSQGEKSCFRDWLSALGGWAAVVAAVPTVYYLHRQVRAAADYQRINFSISVRPNVALAEAAKQSAIESSVHILNAIKKIEGNGNSRAGKFASAVAALAIVSEILKRSHFSEFELRIGLPTKFTVGTLITALEETTKVSQREISNDERNLSEDGFKKRASEYLILLKTTQNYLRSVIEASYAYIEDVNHLGSRIN